jgi:hypothetical protein
MDRRPEMRFLATREPRKPETRDPELNPTIPSEPVTVRPGPLGVIFRRSSSDLRWIF